MIFFKAFFLIISLIAFPCIIGFLSADFFSIKEERRFPGFLWDWLLGTMIIWALFQLVAVPLIFLRQKLSLAILLWIGLLILLTLFFFFYKRKHTGSLFGQVSQLKIKKDTKKASSDLWDKLLLILLLLSGLALIGFQCYHYLFMMHTDADDSRFVASAVDAVKLDYMLLATPATGEYTVIYQDILKDAVSPWMMYLAALSKLFSIHPAILAHTILPSYFLLMGYAVYFLIGLQLTDYDYKKSLFFVDLTALILLFYGGSSHTLGSVILVRIWQGKAISACIMIPLFLAYFIRIYKDPDNKRQLYGLLFLDWAACLLSGMGILFGGFLIGGLGLTELLMSRKWSHIPFYLLSCLPSLIYCVFKYAYMLR